MTKKTTNTSIEDVIPDFLDGDLKESALEFAAYMRESKMPFKIHSTSQSSQSARYKNKIICQLMIYSAADKNFVYGEFTGFQAWLVIPSLDRINNYEDLIIKNGLQNVLWDNALYCVWGENSGLSKKNQKCNPNNGCAGGVSLARCGKTLKGVCMCRTYPIFRNPNKVEIAAIKRLIELEQKARDEN